jgi:hypothetical protein
VILNGSSEVGWLRPGIIGFGQFTDRSHARRAGEAAAAVLSGWYALYRHGAPAAWPDAVPDDDPLIVAGVVVGRVLAPCTLPSAAAVADGGSYGFELAVPDRTWLAVMLQLAQRMYATMVEERLVGATLPLAAGVAS